MHPSVATRTTAVDRFYSGIPLNVLSPTYGGQGISSPEESTRGPRTGPAEPRAELDVTQNDRYAGSYAYKIEHSCSVQDEFRMDRDGPPPIGISVTESVPLLTDLLSKVRDDSPNECFDHAIERRVFLGTVPVDDTEYEAVCEQIERLCGKLAGQATTAAHRGSPLNKEWVGRIDRTDRHGLRQCARGLRTQV